MPEQQPISLESLVIEDMIVEVGGIILTCYKDEHGWYYIKSASTLDMLDSEETSEDIPVLEKVYVR